MHVQARSRTSTSSLARSRSAPRRWSCASSPTARCTTGTRSSTRSSRRTLGWEVVTVSRLVNAFFRWEFNSCETIVKDGEASPIDYANASPDVAIISLHYYFPWAMRALLRWSAFCVVTGRPMRVDLDTREYFAVGDRNDLSYDEKLREYRRLADEYFETDRTRSSLGVPRPPGRADGRVLRGPVVRRVARADDPLDVPCAGAGALRRALPRARRLVGRRPARGDLIR